MTDQAIEKKERSIRILLLILYAAAALSMALMQPHGDVLPLFPNPPDEHARIKIPRFIAENGQLPTGFEKEVEIPGYGSSYAFQPGLPYIIMGIVMRFAMAAGVADFGLVVSARLVNVCFGICCAALLYLLGDKLFRERRHSRLFAAACAFHPQHLFVHTYVNTDSMCMLSIVLMGYALVCVYGDGVNKKNALLLALGQIMCALTYYNAYGFLLCSGLIYLFYFIGRDEGGRLRVRWQQARIYVTLTFVTVLIGAGWWFLRNIILLDGDIFGLATTFRLQSEHGIVKNPPLVRGMSIFEMLWECSDVMFFSFFAAFGSMSLVAGWWFYLWYRLVMSAGLITGIITYFSARRTHTVQTRVIVALSIVAMMITGALWMYYCYAIDYQPQGRYILPLVVPMYICVTYGFSGAGAFLVKKGLPQVWVGRALTLLTALLVASSLYFIYGVVMPVYLSVRP